MIDKDNVHLVNSGSLVRFRCMVQDMFDKEFYCGVFNEKEEATGTVVRERGRDVGRREERIFDGWREGREDDVQSTEKECLWRLVSGQHREICRC